MSTTTSVRTEPARRVARWAVVVGAVLLLAVAALVVIATRGVSWQERVPVVEALSAQDRLTLVVDTCGGDPAVDLLRERDEVVEVAVVSTVRFGGSGGDCQDGVDVRLQAPLGDRRLVDATSGEDVAVDVQVG